MNGARVSYFRRGHLGNGTVPDAALDHFWGTRYAAGATNQVYPPFWGYPDNKVAVRIAVDADIRAAVSFDYVEIVARQHRVKFHENSNRKMGVNMPNGQKFLLAHISDLHFSEGTDRSNPNHAHSIDHLLGLQQSIGDVENLDLLVASGDISNHGDRQSLIMASGWLFRSIPIGKGEYTGLNLKPDLIGIVPGNHDAWNAPAAGTLLDRRQKSLENYNFAFPDHAIPESGCLFRWIEKDGAGIYIAFVDSCFLGDTEQNAGSTFGTLRLDQAVAKGKLTVTQTERLLEWHDRGMQGTLEFPNCPDTFINKEVFAKSLKILVMHHYLFEPPEKKSDYFMSVQHRDIVFRNVALSDFDVLLCGHKHVPAFDLHDYGKHFDRRAVDRYMLN